MEGMFWLLVILFFLGFVWPICWIIGVILAIFCIVEVIKIFS